MDKKLTILVVGGHPADVFDHCGGTLAKHIANGDRVVCLAITQGLNVHDIVITQNDIREVQLAKAAIAAGVQLMMKRMGSEPGQLDRIIVAGAFGNYIDKNSAVTIGLLPDIDRAKIHSAGNTAGAGTLMAVASSKEALRAQQIPEKLEHVELANEPDFQNVYLGAMSF